MVEEVGFDCRTISRTLTLGLCIVGLVSQKKIFKESDIPFVGIVGMLLMFVCISIYGHEKVGPFWACIGFCSMMINCLGGPILLVMLFRFFKR